MSKTKRNPKNEIDQFLAETPNDIKLFVELSFDLVDQVDHILKESRKNRSDLAALLNKSESEISKMLSGMHNMTLRSASKISAVLNSQVVTTPLKEAEKYAKVINKLNKTISQLQERLNHRELENVMLQSLSTIEANYLPKTTSDFVMLDSIEEEGNWIVDNVIKGNKKTSYVSFDMSPTWNGGVNTLA